jgi:DNA polymerase-3 subunit gamma/tau
LIKTALYQLWRPKTLQEIVGQRSVVQTLQNALKLRRLVQAYLFSGPRGSGKTSISRILAKAVNCQSNDQAKPCNQCSNCLSINKGNWVDILEIDAASHRGVDDVRALRDKAAFVPTKGLYKVYIIDEAHMLTTEAANALLKILEEPPAYVLFILATTELHKIPATIASRCQTFSFKRLNISEIVARLTEIVASKDIAAPADALQIIAEHAEGSLRDAIGLLEQALIFSNYKLDQEKTMELLGLLTKTASTNIIQALIKHDLKEVLTLLQAQMTTQGALPEKILQSLISTAKTLLYEQLTT